jgi:electron transport complex protein RnfA
VQERIRFSNVPEPLKGFPISLISASLMALAFMGFMGMA